MSVLTRFSAPDPVAPSVRYGHVVRGTGRFVAAPGRPGFLTEVEVFSVIGA